MRDAGLGNGDRVGLTAQVDAVHAGAVGGPDDIDAAGRVREVAAGGVDDDEDVVFHGRHGRRLVIFMAQLGEGKCAFANRFGGICDVEEADALAGCVGVDDRVAVGGDGGDLGDGLLLGRILSRFVEIHRVRGRAVVAVRVGQVPIDRRRRLRGARFRLAVLRGAARQDQRCHRGHCCGPSRRCHSPPSSVVPVRRTSLPRTGD